MSSAQNRNYPVLLVVCEITLESILESVMLNIRTIA